MSQMTIETNGLERLDEDNQVRMDTSMFQREYAGTSTIDLYLSSDTPGRMLEPDVIRGLARVQTRLQALPTVDKTASVVDLLGRVHQSLGGQGALPNSRAAVAQELLLFELGGGGTLDPLLDFDRGKAHMTLRTSEHRMRALNELGGQAERIAAEELPPDIDVHATGLIAMCGDWLDEIVSGQKLGVFASILSIGLLMVLGLRNLGAGLLSMVPNLLPLMVVAAVCGPIWGDLDSDTLVILMMAIGIGVDDTIHFLTRLRTESLRSTSHTEAIERTFGFAGRAIVMTTIILALGFLPMAMSDYYSMAIMGTLLPLALLVAMSADLLLVPAMAQVGLLRFPNKAA
jgi:predicted RND superfamily exporter protein